MLSLIFFYIVLPFMAAYLVHKLIKKYGADPTPAELRASCAREPIVKRCYRAVRVDGAFGQPGCKVAKIGDFEKQEEAIDAAFLESCQSGQPGRRWYVLNDEGEPLQEYKSQ